MTTISSTAQQVVSQPKVVTPSHSGIMVTQLTPGNLTLRPTGTNQAKVVSAGQSGLLPTQFLVPSGASVNTSQTVVSQQCKFKIVCL